MLRTLLILSSIAFCTQLSAQRTDVTFFSEFGESFTVYVDGVKMNETPAANVKAESLNKDFFQVRVDFEDQSLPDFTANGGAQLGNSNTLIIKRNRKGKFVLRMQSVTPISEAITMEEDVPPPPPPAPAKPTQSAQPASPSRTAVTMTVDAPSTTSTSTTTTTTTTTVKSPETEEKVDIKMEVPGVGVTISMDGTSIDMDVEESETTTTTTTTTITSSETTMTTDTEVVEVGNAKLTKPAPAIPGYNGQIGCDWPMTDGDLDAMKRSISSKDFEDSKFTIAKQATRSKCLKAEQVAEIMKLFDFEETKLDYAKYAYDYTYDQDNYYLVNDSFEFEFTIDELNEYLENK